MKNISTNIRRRLLRAAWAGLVASMACLAPSGYAQQAPAPARAASAVAFGPEHLDTVYSETGADGCLKCHDEESDTLTFTTAGIFRNSHAHRGNPRAPFGKGGLQCEACHGPGSKHSADGRRIETILIFSGANAKLSPQQRNKPCLGCHEGNTRTGWHAGAHAREQLACTDCHKLHVARDSVMARATEPEVCFKCHTKQRADFQKTSSHPVRYGRMVCGDCHNAHGTTSAATLIKPTLNQTCTSCHAEKRGPLLWEHAPVSEDCSLCHVSHGSVRSALLNQPAPLLCQQCHSVAGHPAVARTSAALPGGSGGGQIFLLAGSCTNCHSQVHGSNHPAGAKLMR